MRDPTTTNKQADYDEKNRKALMLFKLSVVDCYPQLIGITKEAMSRGP
jgi:hypothetical protein